MLTCHIIQGNGMRTVSPCTSSDRLGTACVGSSPAECEMVLRSRRLPQIWCSSLRKHHEHSCPSG
eukprot:30993-Pelagococcus_subviridis.AAC.11